MSSIRNYILLLTGAWSIACLMATDSALIAQVEEVDRDNLARHSMAVGDIDSVNLTNGNLSLSIPLAKLLSARGSVGVSYGLVYSSKLYAKTAEEVTVDNSTFTVDLLMDSPEGGWRIAEPFEFEIKDNGYWSDTLPPTHPDNHKVCTIRLKLGGGTAYEFMPAGYGRKGDGFTCSGSPALTTTKIYYSGDGTYMRMTLDPNGTRTVYFPDGSKYLAAAQQPVTFFDRNGNYVQSATVTLADSTQASGWIDQFGRYIARKHVNEEDHFFASGFDGNELEWVVKWKSAGVKRNYRARGSGTQSGGVYDTYYCGMFNVVDEVLLPETLGGLKYQFDYYAHDDVDEEDICSSQTASSPGFGEVKTVTMALGAKNDFNYQINQNLSATELYSASQIIERSGSASTKTLKYLAEYDGSSTEQTETWGYGNGEQQGSIYYPDGTVMTQYHFHAINDLGLGGSPYKVVNPNGSVVERIWAYNNPSSGVAGSATNINPYVKTEFYSIPNAQGQLVLTSIRDFSFDKNGNATSMQEYDWVNYGDVPRDSNGKPTGIPSVTPKRITNTTFYNSTPDASDTTSSCTGCYWNSSAPAYSGASTVSIVTDGSGTPVQRTEITYDDPTTTANPTFVKKWDSFKGGEYRAYSAPLSSANSISTSIEYNSAHLPTITTDANGVQTTFTYGCIDGSESCATTLQNIFPTKTEIASNYPSLKRTSKATYDLYTGAVKSSKDVDNDVTSVTDYDALSRPIKIATGAGAALEAWTQTEYHDADRFIVVKSDVETKGDGRKVATQFYDQLGRVRLSKTLENASIQSGVNESDGIKVQTRYKTVSGYTYQLRSNPYRTDHPSNETDLTMGWTLSTAWSNGLRSEVQTFDGAGLPTAFGGSNTNSTGIVRTDVDADRMLVTDQAGKQRISRTNALGQLKDIWEIRSSESATVSVTFPGTNIASGYQTTYGYDVLNNLTTVEQGAQLQNRTFAYSSLSRLTSAFNPESGTTSYVYDFNGNLTRKTDARGVETDYVYDALNLVTNRNYSTPGGTPANYQASPNVTYTYGTTAPAIGKLKKVESSVSTTEYTSFDILGRVAGHKQTTDGTDYTTAYTYNLAGALIEETYPSTRKVKNVLDNNGDLAMVESKKNSASGYWRYANSFTYNPSGAVTSMQLGNGRWESTIFNSRLQPKEITLGTVSGGSDQLRLRYTYGEWASGSIDETKNNGNIVQQVINVPTVIVGGNTYTGFEATQKYYYDPLNRIDDATEDVAPIGGSSSQSWRQDFSYDRYGNRNFVEANTTTIPKLCGTSPNFTICTADHKKYNPSINVSNNRLSTSDGYDFDSSGNTKADSAGNTFIYDCENKQVEVRNSSSQVVGQYWYDGDGKRIKKYVPSTGENTVFVYDAAGKEIAEYSSVVANSTEAKVSYLTSDRLGSPRMNTDANGAVTARHDYQPFGEEIETSQRIPGLGYAVDTVRKQFTGYERDGETELDFAQARYHDFNLGRFSSPDPFNIILEKEKAKLTCNEQELMNGYLSEPHKWNRFIYVLDNPMNLTDPTGLSEEGGITIKHPDKRLVKTQTDETLIVNIQTKPANPVSGRGDYGQDVFRFDTDVTVTNEKGDVVPSRSTLYYFDVRDRRKQNFNLATGEPIPIVEIVDTDNEGTSSPDRRSATVEVQGVKKDIDYKVQEVGTTVQVVSGSYDDKIRIQGVTKFSDVAVRSNKPDPIVESMRPKQPMTTVTVPGY